MLIECLCGSPAIQIPQPACRRLWTEHRGPKHVSRSLQYPRYRCGNFNSRTGVFDFSDCIYELFKCLISSGSQDSLKLCWMNLTSVALMCTLHSVGCDSQGCNSPNWAATAMWALGFIDMDRGGTRDHTLSRRRSWSCCFTFRTPNAASHVRNPPLAQQRLCSRLAPNGSLVLWAGSNWSTFMLLRFSCLYKLRRGYIQGAIVGTCRI